MWPLSMQMASCLQGSQVAVSCSPSQAPIDSYLELSLHLGDGDGDGNGSDAFACLFLLRCNK